MINTTAFGRRIAVCRKKRALSQSELAERLGVTAQAVSKWENGAALPTLDLLLELSHLYGITINEMLEGENIFETIAVRPYTMEDIAYFVPREERAYNRAWAKEIADGGWVERNWQQCMRASDKIYELLWERIRPADGLHLEIGTGPGGGFMPYVLQHNPQVRLIISDLSPTVVREWKRFLAREGNAPNLHYAALDFCDIPFADGSVDVVLDAGGIGNAEGDRGTALKEVCRILKPGGMLVTATGFVTKETLAALDSAVQKVLREQRPDIFADLYEETVLAGFSTIDSVVTGGWNTDGDDSTIADLARSLGVNLHFTSYCRFCRK